MSADTPDRPTDGEMYAAEYEAGASIREIAAKHHRGYHQVRTVLPLGRVDLRPRGRSRSIPAAVQDPQPHRLTARQISILQAAADGHPYTAIAGQLGASVGTVTNAASAAARLLGATGITHAVAVALRLGIIQ